MTKYQVAAVQMDIRIGDIPANLQKVYERLQESVAQGSWLTVFPECTTTGYCFSSYHEARELAEPLVGPTTQRLMEMCRKLQTRAVVGLIELAEDRIYNSLVLVGPTGILGHYRKVHLPMLGLDRFTFPGDRGFAIVDLGEMRIGLIICYDCSFPEASRILALQGADLIVLPTNWPPTSGHTAELIPPARALENHVYFLAANRVGRERGFDFVGKSRICDPRGATLALADQVQETILYADIDPHFARSKHLVNIPGQHEVHRMRDRHPECYAQLLSPWQESD
jgi:predicted amidohydrolase